MGHGQTDSGSAARLHEKEFQRIPAMQRRLGRTRLYQRPSRIRHKETAQGRSPGSKRKRPLGGQEEKDLTLCGNSFETPVGGGLFIDVRNPPPKKKRGWAASCYKQVTPYGGASPPPLSSRFP